MGIRKNLSTPYKTDVAPDLAEEVGRISDAMRPIREDKVLDDDSKPRSPQGRPPGSKSSREAYASMVARRARLASPAEKKKDRLPKGVAAKAAQEANEQVDAPRRTAADKFDAQSSLEQPFDERNPMTTVERQQQAIAADPAIAAEVVTWQSRLGAETLRSIDTLVFLRDNAYSEQVRLNAAKDILDRAGADMKRQVKATVNIYANASTDELIAALEKLDAIEADAAPIPGEHLLPAGAR